MKTIFYVVPLLLVGCVTPPRPIAPSQLARIESGQTTQAEAQAILGTPSAITTRDAQGGRQTVLTYSANYLRPTAGNQWAATIGALHNGDPRSAGAQFDTQVITVYVGTGGIVESLTVTQGPLPPPERAQSKPVRVGKAVE